jgi:hypothetical protein
MIGINIELQSGKKRVMIPSSWDEITLDKFIRIETEFQYNINKLINLFSILTDIDMVALNQSKQKDLDSKLIEITEFIFKPPDWKQIDKPDKILIGDKLIQCSYDFTSTTLGQKLTMDTIIKDAETPIEAIPKVIGLFLQPTIDGSFDRLKMEALLPEILKLSCIQAYGYSKFFFLRSKHLKSYGHPDMVMRTQRKHSIKKWRTLSDLRLSHQ